MHPRTAYSSQPLRVDWTVKNYGAGETVPAAWYDAVYLSKDQYLDRDSDTYLGVARRTEGLTGGADYSASLTATVPANASGPYYVFVVTDSKEAVFEGDAEDNNEAYDPVATVVTMPAPSDLVVDLVTVPGSGTVGESPAPDITWKVTNQGDNTAHGTWYDSVYLSTDQTWDLSDSLIARVTHTGDVAPGGFYTGSTDAALPGVAPGEYYVLVRSDIRNNVRESDETNNSGASTESFSIDMTALDLGVLATGTIADGEAVYYRIDATAGQDLLITVDLAEPAQTEFYVRYGQPPSRGQFDTVYDNLNDTRQQITISGATEGSYYILLHGRQGAGTGETFEILAEELTFDVQSIGPDYGSNAGQVTVTISGSQFTVDTMATLVAPDDTERLAARTWWVDANSVWATFDLIGLETGLYDVRVDGDGQTALAQDVFTVTDGAPGTVEVNLTLPGAMRPDSQGVAYVEYFNAGETDVLAPLLVLSLENGEIRPPGEIDFTDSSIDFLGINTDGPAGILTPGAFGRYAIPFRPTVSSGSVHFSLGMVSGDDDPFDWSLLKDEIRPETIDEEAWDAIWTNFSTSLGASWGEYQAMLADNATYLSQLGEYVSEVGRLFSFELSQATNALHIQSLTSTVDAWWAAPGVNLSFGRVFAQPIHSRFELGSLGYGWSHNWDYGATTDEDGNARISGPGGTARYFTLQTDGSFAPATGDYAELTLEGDLFRLEEPGGTVYSFRADGRLGYVEDTNGNRITCVYVGDKLTTLLHSSGESLVISYNDLGRIIQVVDPAGRTTQYEYDASGNQLTKVSGPEGSTTYAYSGDATGPKSHAIESITYPGGTHDYFEYDAAGRLARTWQDGGAEEVAYGYDSAGGFSVTDADGATTTLLLDDGGQLVQIHDPLNRSVRYAYDDRFNMTDVVLPTGITYAYQYDSRGNVTRQLDPLGHTIEMAYQEAYNRLESITDQRGNSITYGYDARGNLTSITYEDGSVETYTYDDEGNVTSWTNRRGQIVEYDYDDDGRLIGKDDSTTVDVLDYEYVYDDRGNLESTSGPEGTTSMIYDPVTDWLVRIGYPGGQYFTYAYNDAGQRTTRTDQDGNVVTYHYDAVGRLDTMTDTAGDPIVDYDYDSVGRLVLKTLGNGVYTTYDYDAAGQLLSLVNYKSDDSVLSFFHYTYDSLGRRTQMEADYGTWTYAYDATGQLIHAALDSTDVGIPDQDLIYVYDAAGNRIRTIANGVTTEYSTNEMNQYTGVGGAIYTYDGDGNLVTKVEDGITTVYTYNVENRLIRVEEGLTGEPATDVWEYTYDALGYRIASAHNGEAVDYIVDPIGLGDVVAEYDGEGNLVVRYDHGYGLISQTDALGSAAYYTFDALGSTSELTDDLATVVSSYGYDPFGSVLGQFEAVGNVFQFVGEYGVMSESSSLEFMRARFYVADTGRFISPDSIGVNGGLNLYAYCRNNSVDYIDPRGFDRYPTDEKGLKKQHNKAYDAAAKAAWLDGSVMDPTVPRYPERPTTPTNPIDEKPLGLEDDDDGDGDDDDGDTGLPIPVDPKKKPRLPFQPNPRPHPFPGLGPLLLEALEGLLGSPALAEDVPVVQPQDPNDKVGPSAFGEEAFVSCSSPLQYTVNFENIADASAPAQVVTITDQLDDDLDWRTLQLTEIGFGDQVITVPGGRSFYSTTVDLRPEGEDLLVRIESVISPATGIVTWTLISLDPATGETPDDPLAGFLPPNDETGRGQGYVRYTVRPLAGAGTGMEITNAATIIFDTQEPLDTNEVFNTIDAAPPTSRVETLSSTTQDAVFTVRWTGQDDTGGSGIAGYDIYVFDNGVRELWQQDTTDTEALFIGTPGHTYAFYSVAKDNVGHIEPAPEVADTQVTVIGPSTAGGNFIAHEITTAADGAMSVFAADVDDDGDMDSLSASFEDDRIVWYENDGNEGFVSHTIVDYADGATAVFAADIDGDGDMDVLSASYLDNTIAWYDNDGSENFTREVISDSVNATYCVFATDLDGDGDMDVLSGSYVDDTVLWYENDGNENFTLHEITDLADGVKSVYATDVDGDGDMDVLSASWDDNTIAWYQNDGEENFERRPITVSADGARSVFAADMDGDGDTDVLSASFNDDTIAWYENDGNENFTPHEITTSADEAMCVFAADVDGDGDPDVLSASSADSTVAWYENAGDGNFTPHPITTSAIAAKSVFAADMDGDGNMDVLSASGADDTIAWHENANVLFVDVDAGPGGDGLTWESAFDDLQEALTEAAVLHGDGIPENDVDHIWIAEGTYKPSEEPQPGSPRSASFSLVDGVTLYGGFAGTETRFEERDVSTYITTLSGDIGVVDDSSDNSYTVVYCGENVEAGLDGVVVSHGHAEQRRGGGVYSEGILTVTDSTLRENTAEYGGGICSDGGLTVTNSTFIGNTAEQLGGGIFIASFGAPLKVTNSMFVGNKAEQLGGGIFSLSIDVSVTNTTIAGNSALTGGGIWSFGNLVLVNSIVALNSAEDYGGRMSEESANNLIGVDPKFARTPGTNGPEDYGDLRLTAESVAIDAGDSSRLPADILDLDGDGDIDEPLPLDKDGNPRVFGTSVDIGAYEYQAAAADGRETPATAVSIATDTFDLYDNEISLREAIFYASLQSPAPTVTFEPELSGSTIVLDGTSLLVRKSITIDASSLPGGLTIDGDGRSRVFTISTASDDTVELIGLTITGGQTGIGGGVYKTSGTLTLTDSTVSGNSADVEGGGICNYGTLTVTNSTISGNSAGVDGGGILNDGTLTLTNSTLSGNSADVEGGGICNYGTLTITNSSLSGNAAADEGGGVFSDSSEELTLRNSIVALNAGGSKPDVCVSGPLAGSHNLIGDGSGQTVFINGENGNLVGTAQQPLDPLFIRNPGTNGDDDYGDLRVQPDSPAVDAGEHSLLPADEFDLDGDGDNTEPVPIDLAGAARIQNGVVDIGAFETLGPEHDYGDAPAPYPTRDVDDGAWHTVTGPMLGANRDGETDGQPTGLADGDDLSVLDDEDGLTFGTIQVGQLGATVTVNVQNAPSGAKLDAWIDFNGDGSWGGPGERIADAVEVAEGDNVIMFDVPSWAASGATYARFRVSTAGILAPTGGADDGEVEDYQVIVSSPFSASGNFITHEITTSADGAHCVFAADIDGDGDMDAISASWHDDTIAWYENDGGESFAPHTITELADCATSVFAADVDGDGDVDVLSSSASGADQIVWYENDGTGSFVRRPLPTSANGAYSVFAADVDGDGDMDVVSAFQSDDTIAWYENDGDENFTYHRITDSADGANTVCAGDVDGDGDLDVLSASVDDNTIAWYENDGNENFTLHTIDDSGHAARSVFAADVDDDGDLDVVAAFRDDNTVFWYDNDGHGNFTPHLITDAAVGVRSVFVADVDGDGDMDVLSASAVDDKIAWYENDGDENFTPHTITQSADVAYSVFAADVDGDGDMDVLSASFEDDTIAWYENLNILYVDADASSGGDGLTWDTAFDDLQEALTEAAVLQGDGIPENDIDHIWIAEGTYKPSAELEPGNPRSASFSLVDCVTLCGGFAGTETRFEKRDVSTYITTLSGDLGVVDDSSDNAYTVVYCGENLEAGLDGIVVSHGNADDAEDTVHQERGRGSAVHSAGTLTLTNATFTDNMAAVYGGAVYNSWTGSLQIVDSTFSSNQSGDVGGAVHNAGTMAIDASLFSGNTAANVGGGIANLGTASILRSELRNNIARYGGAIHSDGTLVVESSVLSDNSTTEFGAAAAHLLGTATFVGCDILRNVSDYNGAVFVASGSTSFEDCIFSENRATKATDSEWATGGAVCIEEGNVELLRCTVSGNSAELYGGGIFNRGVLTIVDSSLEDNASDDWGGGIYNDENGTLTVENSTINGNDAANGGGGIVNLANASILESELSNNTAGHGGAIRSDGTLVVESSLLSDNSTSPYGGAAASLKGTATFVDCDIVRNISNDHGAVYVKEGSASFEDCVFSENRSTHSEWGYAGALHNENGTVNLLRCIVLNNNSEHFGGGISNAGELTITNSAVMGNAAEGSGGGAYNSGTLEVVNSLFAGNSAVHGGAMFSTGTLSVTNSTLSGNLASEGGGIYSDSSEELTLHNSILWLNAGENLGGSGSISSAHCLIGVDPKFLRDPSHGGDGWGDDPSTPEIDESANDDYGDLRLAADSPAFDQGDNAHLPPDELDLDNDGDTAEPIPFDLAGTTRIIDGDGDATAIVDIGAYEYIPGDLNGDGYVGSADLDIVRANWGTGIPAAAVRTDSKGSTPASAPVLIGPRRASLSDAALSSWTNANTDHGFSDSDLASLAEAAWIEALESLESKRESKAKTCEQRSAVDLALEGMAE